MRDLTQQTEMQIDEARHRLNVLIADTREEGARLRRQISHIERLSIMTLLVEVHRLNLAIAKLTRTRKPRR